MPPASRQGHQGHGSASVAGADFRDAAAVDQLSGSVQRVDRRRHPVRVVHGAHTPAETVHLPEQQFAGFPVHHIEPLQRTEGGRCAECLRAGDCLVTVELEHDVHWGFPSVDGKPTLAGPYQRVNLCLKLKERPPVDDRLINREVIQVRFAGVLRVVGRVETPTGGGLAPDAYQHEAPRL